MGKFQGNHDHFQAIVRQLDGDGRAAMLHDLLAIPLGDFHPEAMRPNTAALSDQKQHSLGPVEKHVLERLKDGELPTGQRTDTDAVQLGTRAFRDWLVERTRNPDITETAVGRLWNKLGFEKTKGRPSGYIVLPLADARACWDERMFPVQWDEMEDGWDCPPAPKPKSDAHPEGGDHF
ncbi:MAG: hypothetical protein KAI24_12540 [Planctomycetes bacterium]|nr:hypothetical protein [Planctomycetota bacterium]